ncbi:uncharacterized protein LOC143509682 isoform X2 [Brachyhypopomus gauderio]|uniref:uncharacterized protein LOC143509682 isoform X2 n=1 Tax=Brachyhypopomus gauderio TaxID=698409 RepID=UPI0040438338
MKGFSILSIMLPLLMISNVRPVKVNIHDAATLPCSQTCSGLVTWTVSHKPRDILAQCDQTFCQSKEGFHMSHDQYLKGDLSLTITDIDHNKRSWYICTCNGETLCDWNLQVHAFSYNVPVPPGESLTLNVSVSEPVEVVFNKTDHDRPITIRLCEIRGREIQCESEYEKRVMFRCSLQLKEMKESDSGVYTIWDTKNDWYEVIATYKVTVGGRQDRPDTKEKEPEEAHMWALAVVLPLVLLILLVLLVLLVLLFLLVGLVLFMLRFLILFLINLTYKT